MQNAVAGKRLCARKTGKEKQFSTLWDYCIMHFPGSLSRSFLQHHPAGILFLPRLPSYATVFRCHIRYSSGIMSKWRAMAKCIHDRVRQRSTAIRKSTAPSLTGCPPMSRSSVHHG
ncbi:MAG: hypothetical protein K8I29_15970 [Alphaproteobacteria bacterium]|uniref:Uncharacterized protein n=1 Tax=Candidatus Nitrobium versatile TaxID=2884831 RepID=A0A953JAT1_9BACT|nr:hypothetical protein [Candidatus Nitrobium versatile]